MSASEWLSVKDLADELNVSVHTVYAWRRRDRPQGPRAHKIGRHVRYHRSDVDRWIAEHAEEVGAA